MTPNFASPSTNQDVLAIFDWTQERLHWEGLLREAAGLSTLDLVNRWSDLEKYINEIEGLLKWNHYRDPKVQSQKERLGEFHSRVLPELTLYRSQLATEVQGRDLDELPQKFGRALKLVVQKSRLEAELGELLAEEKRLISTLGDHQPSRTEEDRAFLGQVSELMSSTDMNVRKETRIRSWELNRSTMEHYARVLIELLKVRKQMADRAGVGSYQELARVQRSITEFDPGEYRLFRDLTREHLVPLLRQVRQLKARMLGKDQWEFWDQTHPMFSQVDHHPLTVDDVKSITPQVLDAVNPKIRQVYEDLLAKDHLDIGPHDSVLANQLPYSNGTVVLCHFSDQVIAIRDVFHELGHAYQFTKVVEQDLYWNRWPDYKLGETTSMLLDFVCFERFPDFGLIASENVALSRVLFLEDNLFYALANAFHDAFQEQVYQLDPHTVTVEDITRISRQLATQYIPYGKDVPSYGEWQWINIYTFRSPFLHMEYAISYVTAMAMYPSYLQDAHGTLERLFELHRLGGSVSFVEAIHQHEGEFNFSTESVTMLLRRVEKFAEHFTPSGLIGG